MWPEASATAVRELRDRITQRASRHHPGPDHPSVASNETGVRTDRAVNLEVSAQPHYTSSSGLEPPHAGCNNEPNPSSSSMGLPEEHVDSHATQSAARGMPSYNSTSTQASGAPQQAQNLQPYDTVPLAASNNSNPPVFDFGSSEWSDFLQANDTLDASASLPQVDDMDPYIGFDIPFWLGQDQYWDMLHDRN